VAVGCRQDGGGDPVKRGSGSANAATSDFSSSLGEIAFQVLRANLERAADNPQGRVDALDARHDDFVAAIDTILPPDAAGSLSATVRDVTTLVHDGTLPRLTDALAGVLELLANDPQDPQQHALHGLVALAGSRAPLSPDTALELAGRLFAYPDLERLLHAVGQIAAAHDGLDADGNADPNERDLIAPLISTLSRTLSGLERPTGGAGASAADRELLDTLLRPIVLRGSVAVGAPAWVVRLDPNGNPAVQPQGDGLLPAPFVDRDRDGVADIGADGWPTDAAGARIDLPAFGDGAGYDADGRAVTAAGALLYVYVDAKRTPLGQALRVAGEAMAASDPLVAVRALDAAAARETRLDPATGATYPVYADDNPLHDLAWAGLEVFRYRDAPKVLQALAALIRHDEAKAEALLVKLAQVMDIVRSLPPGQGAGAASGRSALDDLVPLLDKAFEAGGSGVSAGRLLLDAMSTEQRRLRNLPVGFARMVKYHDYDRRTPTSPPAQTSIMERLLDMMAEANQCDSWPFGNMAELYLDAMAGNEKILGITISAETINRLMDISFLRSLLCGAISEQNVRALGGFARSGALEAMKPIAKAFSDADRTGVLKDIMLSLQPDYAQKMRPHEPGLVRLLESGVLELLFEILDDMNGVRVPGTGERVSDVVADFLAALVDDDRAITDRRGRPVPSLLHLLLQPVESLGARVDAAGLGNALSSATHALIDVALATDWDDNGTPTDASDDIRVLRNHGIVPLAAALLRDMADGMSLLPWERNSDITRWQQDLSALFTGRDLPVLMDLLLAVDASPQRGTVHQALVALLTPNTTVRRDTYGAVLEAVGALLQAHTDPAALTDVLRFLGRALAPSRGHGEPIVTGLLRLLDGRQGSLAAAALASALDRGPDGSLRSPLDVVLDVIDDVTAAGTQPAQPLTVASLRQALLDLAELLRDREHGLAGVWETVRSQAQQ
jgi:hypothetical protein